MIVVTTTGTTLPMAAVVARLVRYTTEPAIILAVSRFANE